MTLTVWLVRWLADAPASASALRECTESTDTHSNGAPAPEKDPLRFSICGSSPLLTALVAALLQVVLPESQLAVSCRDGLARGVRVELDGSSRWLYVAPTPGPGDDAVVALSEGALVVLHVGSSVEDFKRGLEALVAGNRGYIPVDVARWMATRAVRGPTVVPSDVILTQREREVLECVALGYSNSKVAEELGISVNTVRTHLGAMALKLDASGRADILASAHALGIPEARAEE